MNSEDTILNQQQNDNEETLPNNNQSTSKEQPAKKRQFMETCNNRGHIWNFIRCRQYLFHQLFQGRQ